MNQTIIIGSDHAGHTRKEQIKDHLLQHNYIVIDVGTFTNKPVDYPDVAKKITKQMHTYNTVGIGLCGTGIGMSIAANKVKGIRCAHITTPSDAKLAKQHNHANMIALAGRKTTKAQTIALVNAYLKAKESTEQRHKKRVQKLNRM